MSEYEFESVFKVLAKLHDDCDNDVVWNINFDNNTVEVRATRYTESGRVDRSIYESKEMCERSLLSLYERIRSVDKFNSFFK